MESVLNQNNLNNHLDHLKCGEVFTWQCAGEMYAVECKLCEDQPLCPLSEFSQHMEIWHTDWQEDLKTQNEHNEDLLNTDDDDNEEDQFFNYEDQNDDDDDDHALSFTTEDSGCLFESDDHSSQNLDTINNNEEILQPFEQVLIEQEDNGSNEDSIQIREDGAEECLSVVNKQVAEVIADVTENEQNGTKSNFNINKTLNERKDKQKDYSCELAETERELRYLQEITESKRERNVKETNVNEKHEENVKKSATILKNIQEIEEHLREFSENETNEKEIKAKYQEFKVNVRETSENETETETNKNVRNSLKISINSKNNLKTKKKTRKSKRNLKENKEINENETVISENETNDFENIKTIKEIKKTNRNFKENVMKPRELKGNETETSENETKSRYFKENSTKSKDIKETARNFKDSKELKENETEISEIETETSENETIANESKTSNKTNDFKNSIKIANFDDSLTNTPPNLTKIKKISINLRKSLRNLHKFQKTKRNSQQIQHTATNKRNLSKNQENLTEMKQMEMKQVELNISATDESETVEIHEKFNKVNKIKTQNSGKSKTTKRNFKKCSRDSNEMEHKKREFENLQENFGNYRKSLLVLRTNAGGTRKCKIELANSFNEDRRISESDFSIEESFPRQTKRKLRLCNSKIENLELQTSKALKLTQDSLNRTTRNSSRTCSLSSFNSSQEYSSTKDNSSPIPQETLSPLSPNTEEEHFELYRPTKKQLNKHHISHLIKLYQEHPRLWEQAHLEFCEPQLCRKSWQQITDQWNEFCQRNFSIAEVRIRLGTLCQRYVQERERLAFEGELDEFAKFPYYEQMQFLEQQESLQKRTELYEQQNEKILKIYQLFPLLWHINCYKLRQSQDRAEAFQNISQTLKLSGLHLSSMAVQKRIRSLRKCYRLEKIRFLHAQVEQTPFESSFCHYENMKFLHKHIEPFRCRICGTIFENLTRFREHLEEENHGDVLQEDSESERLEEEKENADTLISGSSQETLDSTAIQKNLLCFSNMETSSDILQNFSPLPATPSAIEDSATNLNLTTTPVIQEVIIFPSPTPAAPLIDSFHLENQLLEEIMENVSNDDSFAQKSLDQFINAVTSSEMMSPNSGIIEESLSCDFMNAAGIEELSDNHIIIEETLTSENAIIFNETQVSSSLSNVEERRTEKITSSQNSQPSPLVVNVQCIDFSLDAKINSPPYEILNRGTNDSDNDINSSGDISTLPLPDGDIHKMIALYRKYPQIWNPNHLDYNSRNLRRQAWCQLTKEFSATVDRQFSWRTLHRKLTDYAKYYKKLITEQKNYEELENKWSFYEDFKFLDDVLIVHDELQRSVHHRDNNFKIIKIYETLPQLWDIKHPDYSKRSSKPRLIEVMCNRLQEEHNLQLTTERLKHRLIELRAQYRTAKKQRLKCESSQQNFQTDFEFYEAFKFLDPHIDPFICDKCGKDFKKLTDYNLHIKREHEKILKEKPAPLTLLPTEPGVDKNLQNICHICGLKFTNRSNLVHHVRRHEGKRNYECTMCPKKFYASHPLKIHIRSHTKECPYTCEKCGISFVSASKLNQHVKRHLDKKDFQCDYCSKSFYTGFEKHRHERRHLNIRDKVCPVCGKTFVVGSSYYAHMMLHNDTKRFECEVCSMKFAQYAGLYKHKKKYHPR